MTWHEQIEARTNAENMSAVRKYFKNHYKHRQRKTA